MEAKPADSKADRALLHTAKEGNIEAVKQHLANGVDVKDKFGRTPQYVKTCARKPNLDLIRKNGGKTETEPKAEGK